MSYADAINNAVRESIEQLEDYGGFLAQAGIELEDDELGEDENVILGYARQLKDFPNG